MRPKDVKVGQPVWRHHPGDGRIPGIVAHVAGRDIWVSYTTKVGGQAKLTAADLEPRRVRP